MCGICGFVHTSPSLDEARLRKMCGQIGHRGPDASEVKLFSSAAGRCGLGHVRLSIIDLAGGAQPMPNEDESVWISYNGEVYNHLELKSQMEAKGHSYRTRCDTESLVHLYEEYGEEMPRQLRGMFSFAIWDETKQELFLCRDRLGIKPLYYALVDGGIVFASEIKSILSSGLIVPQVNSSAMAEYAAFGYVTGEQTLFAGIQRLNGGHTLRFRAGQEPEIRQYWDVRYDMQQEIREEEAVETLQQMFQDSVKMRMMSDVPLGVFLSGGLDSSAIAGAMSRESATPVQAFSIGFESKYYSETGFARSVADYNGMKYRECILGPEDFVSSIEKLIWHCDSPIHFPASVALYHLSKLARQHVTVVLTGEGSDEIFAGYQRYISCQYNMVLAKMLDPLVPSTVRRHLRQNMWQWPLPLKLKKAISHTFLYHSKEPGEIIYDNYYRLNGAANSPQPFSADFIAQGHKDDEKYLEYFDKWTSADTVSRMLYADKKTYLDELLKKQDRMSMAASIESRVPFLDHKMVEYAATLPTSLKARPGNMKYVLKQVVKEYVPPHIIKRTKMGFPIPLGEWLREPLFNGYMRDVLHDKRTVERGAYQPQVVQKMIDEHEKGLRDNSYQLWMLLNFELWNRRFIDGGGQ